MKNSCSIFFLLVLILLFQSGCTSEVEKTNAFESNPVIIDLAGRWQSNCIVTGNQESLSIGITVSQGLFTYTETHFQGGIDCESPFQTIQINHTFEPSGAVSLEEPEGAKTLDLRLVWSSAKTSSPEQTEDFSEREVCGHGKWELNRSQYITGRDCDWSLTSTQSYPKIGTRHYDIYTLTDSPQKLSFGNRLAIEPDLRPTGYDEALSFHYIDL